MRLKKINLKEIPAYVKGGVTSIGRDIGRMRGTNVWIFILYGLLLDTVNNLWRPFSAKFLVRLGGGELEITLLNALPGLVAAIVLLPGAMLFRRFTNRQRATAAFILVSRALLLGIALIPMLPAPVRPMLFIILVAVMNCPDALSQTSMQSFLGTVFGGTTRGQAIALRTKFGQAIIPIVTIVTGLIITYLPRSDQQRMILYQIFFLAAFLVGVLEVMMFNRLKVAAPKGVSGTSDSDDSAVSPAPHSTGGNASSAAHSVSGTAADEKPATESPASANTPAPSSDMALIPVILRDRRFLAFFIPAIIFTFTWQAGGPIFAIHQVMTIRATEMWLAVFTLASCAAAFASGGLWQRWLRSRGNNAVFIISASLLSANLIFLPLITNVQLMALFSIFTGFSTIGITAAILNGVLEASPDENRMMYVAFFNMATNISLFLAPFFANALLSFVGDTYTMLIVGAMRGAATVLIWLAHRRSKGRSMEEASA
ncbi:MAG: MFS transporter [Defluviitaleaceae bacterium]|nr:MFS transporter [Defluviitaleaceae bacterium]